MGIATFKIGSMEVNGTSVTNLISGTANVTHNVEDTNAIGESWRAGTVLGGQWDVSLECHYDPAAVMQASLVSDFVAGGNSCLLASVMLFTLTGSKAVIGSAIITNATITKAVGSTDKLSITLQGNGAVTYA